eukprot:gene8974-10525_t
MEGKGQTPSHAATSSMSASMMESFKPLKNIDSSLNCVECVCGDVNKQVVTYHLCSNLDNERMQCLIYDSDKPDAKLLGVEYVITEQVFSKLPMEERKFWHSHKYIVESGMLAVTAKALVPNVISSSIEVPVMKHLVNTYGKTWMMWPIDESGNCSAQVPTGPPQLMMSSLSTKESLVNVQLFQLNNRFWFSKATFTMSWSRDLFIIIGSDPIYGKGLVVAWDSIERFNSKRFP